MKKGLVFILGIVTGILLTVITAYVWASSMETNPDTDPRIIYFNEPTDFTISDKFEVFQVLPTGALAQSRNYSYSSEIYSDPIVFIIAKDQNTYYNDQIINAVGSKVMQLGTFKYSSQSGERVVPVLEILPNHNAQSESQSLQTYNKNTDGEITYADKPSSFTASNKFKVDEVLEHGVVAKCKEKDMDLYFEPRIYIPAEGQNMYYNDQIITVPAGKKAVQVGTIRRYSSVYPIIEFQ